VDLIVSGRSWSSWASLDKARLSVLFLPLVDSDIDPLFRGQARLLNVHLFKNYTSKPPKMISEVLERLPVVARTALYANAFEVRAQILENCPSRPVSWPSVE
jgi:hypothetical protein